MPAVCCVFGCRNRSNRDAVKFFRIPKVLQYPRQPKLNELSKMRHAKWLLAIQKGVKEINLKHARICSNHFISGKPSKLPDVDNIDWIPCVNMGYVPCIYKNNVFNKERREWFKARSETKLLSPAAVDVYEHVPLSINKMTTFLPAAVKVEKIESPEDDKYPLTSHESEIMVKVEHSYAACVLIDTAAIIKREDHSEKIAPLHAEHNYAAYVLNRASVDDYGKRSPTKQRGKDLSENKPIKTEIPQADDYVISVLKEEDGRDAVNSPEDNVQSTIIKAEDSIETSCNSHEIMSFNSVQEEIALETSTQKTPLLRLVPIENLMSSLPSKNRQRKPFNCGLKTTSENLQPRSTLRTLQSSFVNCSLKRSFDKMLPNITPKKVGSEPFNHVFHGTNSIETTCNSHEIISSNWVQEEIDSETSTPNIPLLRLVPIENLMPSLPSKNRQSKPFNCGLKTTRTLQHMIALRTLQSNVNFDLKRTARKLAESRAKIQKKVKLPCKYCKKQLSGLGNLNRHLRTHIKATCHFCNVKLTTRSTLNKHIKRHLDNLNFKLFHCPYCNKKISNASTLKSHIHMHRCQWTCDLCQKLLPSKSRLEDHIHYHLGTSKYKCKVCKKRLCGRFNLAKHMQTHTDHSKLICFYCLKGLSNRHSLTRHIRNHFKSREQVCRYCMQPFSSKKSLSLHIKTLSGNCKFSCGYCYVDLFTKKTLASHIRSHTEGIKHNCHLCGKNLPSKARLEHHVKLHLRPKFTCDLCQKQLSNKTSLEYHIRAHVGNRIKFTCDYCQRDLSCKQSLEFHKRTHLR